MKADAWICIGVLAAWMAAAYLTFPWLARHAGAEIATGLLMVISLPVIHAAQKLPDWLRDWLSRE